LATPVPDAYNADPLREWERLERSPYIHLEFELTWDALNRRLSAGEHVLDAGGGPGRYSLELCRAGWQVTLVDITSGLLEVARTNFAAEPPEVRARLRGIEQADLRDLSRFEDHAFDATVCLGGPLTHLPVRADQEQAVREMARVTRPGGLIYLTGVGYLAVLRYMLNFYRAELLADYIDHFLDTGEAPGPGGMLWHFFRADELRELAESCGLETLEMVGCQGLSSGLSQVTNEVANNEPEAWAAWRKILFRTSQIPAVVDGAEHILWVGRRSLSD